ncbi:MAG TPA: hypothetical protein VN633_06095 [Bryobacteraceae bacterium]|nr:hypothetical protein [Bryobacteraceae bacterium]
MRKYVYVIFLLALASLAAVALVAQSDQTDPFVGTWKLNVAKSKINPGPAPKSETVTITNDKTTVEGVDAEGKSYTWSFTSSAEKAVPIEGMENSTVLTKRSGRTVDATWDMNGGKETGHGVISKDGKTMKYTMTGTNAQGQKAHNVLIFEKQ